LSPGTSKGTVEAEGAEGLELSSGSSEDTAGSDAATAVFVDFPSEAEGPGADSFFCAARCTAGVVVAVTFWTEAGEGGVGESSSCAVRGTADSEVVGSSAPAEGSGSSPSARPSNVFVVVDG